MIDIIIPVYNAIDEFRKCFESVIKHISTNEHIIIVDDTSPDPLIQKYFHTIEKKFRKQVTVIHHKKNLGFVGSVNTGMQSSKNDVILLNSDTIVTKGWTKKMHDCAHSSELIATVSPLSNNGSLCSVPNFGIDNKIPDGYTIDSFGELIEKRTIRMYPVLPTTIGFCMYIKRSVLDLAGLFNQEIFGKGYGEENEFCLRTRELGFEHVLDDATFVYHSGSASFTDERRKKRVIEGMKKILKLYPNYDDEIQEFLKNNPLKSIHVNVKFWLDNEDDGKPNVLFVKHFEPTIGGTGINTYQIIRNSNEFNFYVLYPWNGEALRVERWVKGKLRGEMVFKRGVTERLQVHSWNRNIEDIFKSLLQTFEISIVHFQHISGLPETVLDIPKKLGIPTIFSIHDFFIISKELFLRDHTKKTPTYFKTVKDYMAYLERSNDKESKLRNARISLYRKHLKNIDSFVVPSEFVRRELSYLLPKKNFTIIEHGVALTKLPLTDQNLTSRKLTIGFIGVGDIHKGINDFLYLSQDKQIAQHFNFKIIGDVSGQIKVSKDPVIKKSLQTIKRTGFYDAKDIQRILVEEEIDIVLLPVLCPETFSYTLSEAVQTNIPVIGKNLGAIGERIKKQSLGWTYNTNTQLKQLLTSIGQDHNKLVKMQKQISKIEMRSVVDMVVEYNKLYAKNSKSLKSSDIINHHLNHFVLTGIFAMKETRTPKESRIFKIKKAIRAWPLVGEPIYSIYTSIRDGASKE